MMELVLLALIHFTGVDIPALITQVVHKAMQSDAKLLNLDAKVVKSYETTTIAWIKLMIPALLSSFAFFFSAINLLLTRALISRTVKQRPLLLTWVMPRSVILVYVISLSFVLFGWLKTWPYWWQIANNVMYLTGLLIGIQGLSMIWRRLHTHSLRSVWVTLLVLLTVIPYVRSIYVLLGLVDSVIILRKQ
jgi:uncharacterized protein YybS (DUF2232 family)